MSKFFNGRKAALAGVLAATAIGAAAPAQAHQDHPHKQVDCETRYERLEATFRFIEARAGWDAASAWWNEAGWPNYSRHCPNG